MMKKWLLSTDHGGGPSQAQTRLPSCIILNETVIGPTRSNTGSDGMKFIYEGGSWRLQDADAPQPRFEWIEDTEIVGYMSIWLPGLSTTRLQFVLSKDVVLKLCFETEVSEPNKFGWYRHRVTIQKKRYTFLYVSSDTTTRPVIFNDHQE